MFAFLLETGIDMAEVLLKNEEPEGTLLSWAAKKGHERVVKQLLALDKVDVECKGKHDGRTPLMWAAKKGHAGVVKQLLLTGGANVESRDVYGSTSLALAIAGGHDEVVKLLEQYTGRERYRVRRTDS
jgi:ankyrin repeat protein